VSEQRRVWLVERTYSDDEQNLIILTYATPDGTLSFRKERALTSFTGPARETTVSLTVSEDDLSEVGDADRQEWYRSEASRMADVHDPDDTI
jgi:hypothetical protein